LALLPVAPAWRYLDKRAFLASLQFFLQQVVAPIQSGCVPASLMNFSQVSLKMSVPLPNEADQAANRASGLAVPHL
jgi:hypothetical protein